MKILLDTHAFLWFIAGNLALSRKGRGLIEDDENEKLVSIASITEMAIKTSLNKLTLERPFGELIPEQLRRNDFKLHQFTVNHAVLLSTLPLHHRDPFDRMIVVQGLGDNLPILSNDSALDAYGINRLW